MNYDAQMIIKKELDSGERLLWAGMPKQGTIFKGTDVFMIGGFKFEVQRMGLILCNAFSPRRIPRAGI